MNPIYSQGKILKNYFNFGDLKKLGNEKGEMDNVLKCAYLFKHESFCTESEIRLTGEWNRKIAESEFSFKGIIG